MSPASDVACPNRDQCLEGLQKDTANIHVLLQDIKASLAEMRKESRSDINEIFTRLRALEDFRARQDMIVEGIKQWRDDLDEEIKEQKKEIRMLSRYLWIGIGASGALSFIASNLDKLGKLFN